MRDARRRNRNIGTSKSGHGQNNKHVVPNRWNDLSSYWEKLNSPVIVQRQAQKSRFTFIVEPTLEDYVHFCTIEDVCGILELLPIQHIQKIELIIFRQPTRRQQTLVPVWGRLGYWSDIVGYSGPGIYIEAQQLPRVISWPLSLTPDQQQELERLQNDGHEIERTKRSYEIKSSFSSIRSTQLYRTVPHEVGHYVDYLESSSKFDMKQECEKFWALYGAKSPRDKEAFAHRYAEKFGSRWLETGQLPFEPIIKPDAMKESKINPQWFGHAT